MKILVACEFSGIVREAFKAKGHDAWSCDLLPTEREGQHIQGDVLGILNDGWDLMIAHPPCTYLCVTGNKWFKPEYKDRFPDRPQQREDAVRFFMALAKAPIPKIAIENPVCIMSTKWRKPDQIIQPYYFGDPHLKKTCLWLKGLSKLAHYSEDTLTHKKTHIEPAFVTYKSRTKKSGSSKYPLAWSGKATWKIRSTTFQGIADAMAEQWGK